MSQETANASIPEIPEDEYKNWDGTTDFPEVENVHNEDAF